MTGIRDIPTPLEAGTIRICGALPVRMSVARYVVELAVHTKPHQQRLLTRTRVLKQDRRLWRMCGLSRRPIRVVARYPLSCNVLMEVAVGSMFARSAADNVQIQYVQTFNAK